MKNPHSTSKSLFHAVSAPRTGKSVGCTVLRSIGRAPCMQRQQGGGGMMFLAGIKGDVLIVPYKVPVGGKGMRSNTVSYLMNYLYRG